MINNRKLEFFSKMIATHSVTYMLMGIIASTMFNYADKFANPVYQGLMRPLDDPLVMMGPVFQPIRGFIFALVLLPFAQVFLENKQGWFYLWGLFVGLGMLSTFGPAPGSIEAMIYSTLPIFFNLGGWLEILLQSFLLSVIFIYWFKHPEKKWLSWLMGIAFLLTIAFPILGLLATQSG